MNLQRPLAVLLVSLASSACGGSSWPQPNPAITVRATAVPEGARDLGPIKAEVRWWQYLPELVAKFQQEAANLGGNFAKVDEIRMEIVTTNRGETHTNLSAYAAGAKPAAGAFSEQGATSQGLDIQHVATTLVGRAFKVGGK